MTDQPQGPTPPEQEPGSTPEPAPEPTPPVDPTVAPAPEPPPAAPQQPAPPAPVAAAPAADPQQGYPQQGHPQQPGYPPPAPNPYGGYAQAPAYAGGRPMHPGSIGYVEQYFGVVATFGQRVLALLIDTLLSLLGLIPVVIGAVLLVAAAPKGTGTYDDYGYEVMGDGDGGLAAVGGILIALGVLLVIGISLWNRVFRMGRTGQSIGKKVIGLRLLDDKTGQPIGAGMCFLRELVHSIVNQVIYLSYLWMLWDTDRQTLADKAVHSTVVVVPKG